MIARKDGGSDQVVSFDAFRVTKHVDHTPGRIVTWSVKPLTPWARELLHTFPRERAMEVRAVFVGMGDHAIFDTGVKYPGHIVFAIGTYGDDARAIVKAEFGEAGDGPWFYYGINDWLGLQDVEPGVYRFDGWYRLCKNGRHQFVGKIKPVTT